MSISSAGARWPSASRNSIAKAGAVSCSGSSAIPFLGADGQKRSKVEVLANDVTFLDSRGGGESGGYEGGNESATSGGAETSAAKPKPSKQAKKDDVVIEDIAAQTYQPGRHTILRNI